MNARGVIVQELAFHPASEIFPLMGEDDLWNLTADIRDHGLREPIVLHPDGSILDGRNRYRACVLADVSPRFRTWDGIGSPLDFVISLNLKRRQLTAGQLAMVALKVKPMLEEEARERQRAGLRRGDVTKTPPCVTSVPHGEMNLHRANDLAGATVGVSGRAVARAARVVRDGVPALADAVRTGEITINAASQIATRSPKEQVEILAAGPKMAASRGWKIDQERRAASRVREPKNEEAPVGSRRLPKRVDAADFRRSVQTLQGICIGLTKLNTAEILKASDASILRDSLREVISTLRGVYRALGGNGESHG